MSTSLGSRAESAAAEYLKLIGYEVVGRNWRTPMCEIDIIAKKGDVIYFVEVKFRSRDNQGGGIEYITPAKIQQMAFAARCWAEETRYNGDYCLAGIEVATNFEITEFIDCID
jgi:putative endonuclease